MHVRIVARSRPMQHRQDKFMSIDNRRLLCLKANQMFLTSYIVQMRFIAKSRIAPACRLRASRLPVHGVCVQKADQVF